MAKKKVASWSHLHKKITSRTQQLLPLRSLAIALIAILFCSLSFSRIMWLSRKKETVVADLKKSANDGAVDYIEVSSGSRDDVRRYAAVVRSSSEEEEEPLSIRSWMSIVASNSSAGIQAASDVSGIIASSPYASVLFETPGTSWQSSDEDQFEFALVNKPALREYADKYAFEEHFRSCGEEEMACSFANLGGDARLVSPLPRENVSVNSYSHLAAFVRNAPEHQVAEFWRLSAKEYLGVLEQKQKANPDAKTWFSTNGMGVAWLHLRLDNRPKYYSYSPFK